MSVMERSQLEQSPLADLHALASEIGVEGFRRLRREELIDALLGGRAGDAEDEQSRASSGGSRRGGQSGGRARSDGEGGGRRGRSGRGGGRREPEEEKDEQEPEEVRSGVLDILPNGNGFLRAHPFAQSADDVYVAPAQIRRCELRPGDQLAGPVRPPRGSERHPSLAHVESVNGGPAEPPAERPRFEELAALLATERLSGPEGLEGVPFGKGSRVAVIAPAGTDASALLRQMVARLLELHAELDIAIVPAGARPEEVTEWRRQADVPVAGGGFDQSADEHARAAEMAGERAKRAVERGGHGVLVVDGLDVLPLELARSTFGLARRTEEAGSLTVLASLAPGSELERYATTRVVLEPVAAGDERGFAISPGSGAIRADLLS